MKKLNKKKKLPKYWLGTRIPTSLGYQPNLGIGGALFSSQAGENITPEVNAMRSNILPSALSRASLTSSPVIQALGMTKTIAPTSAAIAASNQAMTQAGSNIAQLGAKYGSSELARVGTNVSNLQGGMPVAQVGLTTAGKVVAGVGAAYGVGQGVYDWIHNKDARSAGDMSRTLTTNRYTTDYGNSYDQLSGLDAQAERNYASVNKTTKNVSNIINGIGTGASIGTLAYPGIGTAIGAVGGALYGLGSWALGFGDTSEETENAIKNTQDYLAMYNRQLKSGADSADVKAGFYNRDSSGRVGAKDGKTPAYSKGKKPNARVSHGETNVHKDGTYEVYPGRPDREDSLTRHVADSDTIFSNNDILTGESASKYFLRTNDYYGALAMDEANRRFIKENNIKDGMLHAKCGKMPRYVLGTAGEYALATLPHFGLYLLGLMSYNRAKKADVQAPNWQGDNAAGAAAINQLYSDMIDPRQYLNRSNRNYAMAAWNARRTPGLGLGGRAVLLDSLYRGKLALDAETLMKINEANRTQRNTAANMKYNYGDKLLGLNYDNFWRNAAFRQQANAARENWMEQAQKNQVTAGIDAASDMLKVMQTNQANAIKNKMIGLYEDNLNLDWYRLRAQYPDAEFWDPTQGIPGGKKVPKTNKGFKPYTYDRKYYEWPQWSMG